MTINKHKNYIKRKGIQRTARAIPEKEEGDQRGDGGSAGEGTGGSRVFVGDRFGRGGRSEKSREGMYKYDGPLPFTTFNGLGLLLLGPALDSW